MSSILKVSKPFRHLISLFVLSHSDKVDDVITYFGKEMRLGWVKMNLSHMELARWKMSQKVKFKSHVSQRSRKALGPAGQRWWKRPLNLWLCSGNAGCCSKTCLQSPELEGCYGCLGSLRQLLTASSSSPGFLRGKEPNFLFDSHTGPLHTHYLFSLPTTQKNPGPQNNISVIHSIQSISSSIKRPFWHAGCPEN